MISSKKEQEDTTNLIISFLKEYAEHKKKVETLNNNFLSLLSNLIKENQINKELINNLSNKVNELETKQELNFKKSINSINDLNNKNENNFHLIGQMISSMDVESKKQLNELNKLSNTLINLEEIISSNNDLFSVESDKQKIEFGKINEEIITLKNITKNKITEVNENIVSVGEFLDVESNKNNDEFNALKKLTNDKITEVNNNIGCIERLISTDSNKLFNKLDVLYKLENGLNNIYLDHHNEIKSLLSSHIDVTNNLNKAVQFFTQNYSICKMYFFNNQEKELKQYLDTDELFRLCYFNNIKFLSYSPAENKILLQTKEGIILGTNNRFYTIKEVIGFDGYSVPQLYQFKEFVVFDIGMNRGYASLRFAEFENCAAVYGFEIDDDTYNKAIYNINLNTPLSKKIKPYNFGLSNVNKKKKLYYLEGADGLNTLKKEFIDIQYELKDNKEKIQTKFVEVKNASEIIGNIIKKDKISSNIVLKIDTEGSEYDILDELINSGLINKIDLIIGEGHNFNNKDVTKKLSDLGFKEIDKKDNIIVYNFAYVRKEHYDIWKLKK